MSGKDWGAAARACVLGHRLKKRHRTARTRGCLGAKLPCTCCATDPASLASSSFPHVLVIRSASSYTCNSDLIEALPFIEPVSVTLLPSPIDGRKGPAHLLTGQDTVQLVCNLTTRSGTCLLLVTARPLLATLTQYTARQPTFLSPALFTSQQTRSGASISCVQGRPIQWEEEDRTLLLTSRL